MHEWKLAVTLFLGLGLAARLPAHEITYSAVLSGPAEQPPNSSPGVGAVLITWDLDLVTMRVEANFSGLVSTSTAAHIHGLTTAPGSGAAIVATQLPSFPGFPLGVTAGVYDQTFDMTVAASYNPAFITASGGTVSQALNALIFGMDQGRTYFNIHTEAFPAGEIRGFITPVPEPAVCILGGVCVSGLSLLARGQWRQNRRAVRSGSHTKRIRLT